MKTRHTLTLSASLCLLLGGCDAINAPLEGGGGMLMDPEMGGGMGATSAAGLWGGTGLLGYRLGQATADQKSSAEADGRNLLAQESVKKQIAKKKIRYVAVPVKATPSQKALQKNAGPAMVKVNVDTGKAQGDVFSADKKQGPKSGEEIKLGGDATLYFATTGDKL